MVRLQPSCVIEFWHDKHYCFVEFSPAAPAAIGPYSQAIVAPPYIFVSGCLGFDPKSGAFVEGGVVEQAKQALQNMKAIVEGSGSEVGKVVKVTVRASYLVSISHSHSNRSNYHNTLGTSSSFSLLSYRQPTLIPRRHSGYLSVYRSS